MALHISLEDALTNGRGVERPFCCPTHDDSNASASVNTAKGLWVCYACRASGTLEGWSPTADDIIRMLDRKDERQRTYPETWLAQFDADHTSPYWAKRYGEGVSRTFRCGTDPWTGMPTYPLRNAAGQIIGVVRRNDVDDDQPKYLYPPNTHTSRTLFGIERVLYRTKRISRISLVEGASDVLAVFEADKSEIVLGTYGAGLHAPQVELIHQINPSEVVGAFDDDDAGRAAVERATEQLQGIKVTSVAWLKFGGTDAGSIKPADRTRALSA